MSKFVGPVPSSYKERIYRAAVSQSLRNTGLCRPCDVTTYVLFVQHCTVCSTGNIEHSNVIQDTAASGNII